MLEKTGGYGRAGEDLAGKRPRWERTVVENYGDGKDPVGKRPRGERTGEEKTRVEKT